MVTPSAIGERSGFQASRQRGGAFPEVEPVQGKGIAASHLLMRDRR